MFSAIVDRGGKGKDKATSGGNDDKGRIKRKGKGRVSGKGKDRRGGQDTKANFFSLADNRVYKIDLPKAAPISRGMWIGSSHGWVVTADERSELSLLNPISRKQIHLPPVASFDHIEPVTDSSGQIIEYLVDPNARGRTTLFPSPRARRTPENLRRLLYRKAVLSSSPATGDYIVMLLLTRPFRKLAFARAKDSKWTLIESPFGYTDIVYHKAQFYTVTTTEGVVESWDFTTGSSPTPTLLLPDPVCTSRTHYVYLVSSPWGDLLHVQRLRADADGQPTERFIVCRVDLERRELLQLDSLGHHVLFLGCNASACLSSLDDPALRGNCIYFTDDHWECCHRNKDLYRDIGIYDLNSGCILPVLPPHPRLKWPPPIWITPSLT